ncbi:MAG: MqnA/MqnD/SBP family protein, partial [Isosphaeraceae bacterium]
MTSAELTTIRVGHSPDSDDAFMFYALTHDRLDTGGLRFVHQLEDIETLNRRALSGELEVSAVSIHAFAYLADRYALLASGASMGDRYGPTIITRTPMKLDDLRGKTIAVPGLLTTAYLTLQLCLGKDVPVTVMPFDQILPAVADG